MVDRFQNGQFNQRCNFGMVMTTKHNCCEFIDKYYSVQLCNSFSIDLLIIFTKLSANRMAISFLLVTKALGLVCRCPLPTASRVHFVRYIRILTRNSVLTIYFSVAVRLYILCKFPFPAFPLYVKYLSKCCC